MVCGTSLLSVLFLISPRKVSHAAVAHQTIRETNQRFTSVVALNYQQKFQPIRNEVFHEYGSVAN